MELSTVKNLTGVDLDEFKEAFKKFHSYKQQSFSGYRQQLKDDEYKKKKEAASLVKAI